MLWYYVFNRDLRDVKHIVLAYEVQSFLLYFNWNAPNSNYYRSFSLKPIQQLIKHYHTRSVDCTRSSNMVDILASPCQVLLFWHIIFLLLAKYLHNILDTFFFSLFSFGTGRNIWEASHIWSFRCDLCGGLYISLE